MISCSFSRLLWVWPVRFGLSQMTHGIWVCFSRVMYHKGKSRCSARMTLIQYTPQLSEGRVSTRHVFSAVAKASLLDYLMFDASRLGPLLFWRVLPVSVFFALDGTVVCGSSGHMQSSTIGLQCGEGVSGVYTIHRLHWSLAAMLAFNVLRAFHGGWFFAARYTVHYVPQRSQLAVMGLG
ncbi:hypothetical protein GE09DRAFT_24283 [Coniochaeta sp. 2T2.1]|nr:hypothetical protein GE09DRAFT_24283 [Coniochaeta sp. 2T2.1]